LTGTKLGAFRVTVLPELISIAPTGGVGSGARSAVVTLTATGFATGSVVRIGAAERDPTDPGPGNPTKPFYVQQQDSQVIMRSAFRAFAAGDGGTVVIDVTENQAQTADRRLAVTIESADGTYRFTCDPLGGATCNSGLTINRPPVVSAITPPLGVGATGKTPSISGQRFVVPGANPIADPGTMVTLPTGVTGACTAANATTINCTGVAVAATVVPGNVSVIVTNPDGGRTAGALTINAPPVISSLSPASATAGTSFTVTVLGSGFQAGLLQPEFGDITVNSFQRIDAATVDINVTIPSGAADGYRPLTITNPDGGVATAPQAFYIGTPPTDTASVLATFGEKGESLVQYQRSLGSSWGALSESPVLSSPPVWQVMKANPTRDERLLAVVDDQRRLTVHVWNGQTWANAQAAASSTGLARPSQTVDVAFEQQSGRGVVVYATTESTTLRYRLWDGTSWSAEALVEDLVNGQQTTGRPLWVRLEARPTTNDLVLVYGDQNNAIAASVWRGNRSQWEDTVLLTNAAASHDAPIFDVAFERATGQAMVVWATGVETTPHFRIWSRQLNDAGGWQSEATAPSIGVTTGQPIRALRMVGDASNAASPTNRIVLAASSGTAAPVLEALVWNGTQWSGGVPPLAASLRAQDGGRGFDLASQGGNGNVLAVYATTANPNGVSRTYSGTWSSEVDMSLPASASPDPSFPAWTELASSVGINDVAVTQFDTLGRVLLARWSGTVWSAAIEAQPLGSGLVGSPPVAGKSVAVTLAEDQIRNDGPGIVIPPTSPVETIIPGTPTLSAGTATINTANLSWSAVASDGLTTGGMVARYEVQQTLGSVVTTQSVNASQTPGGTEIYMVTGLSGAKTYLFNVRAVDAAGNRSPWSNRVTVVTPAAQPPPVTGLAVPLGSIQRTSLALVWQRPTMGPDNAALAEYIVKYKTGGPFTSEQDFDIAQPEIRSDTEAITIEGLSFGVTYWFAVKVVDVDPSSPNSVMSSAIQATTADHAPDAITDLRVIGTTPSSVTLRWTMPDDDFGAIVSYTVKYTRLTTIGTILTDAEFNLNPPQVVTFPGQPERDESVQPFVETLQVTGLAADTQYWFSVKSIDSTGQLSPLSGSPTAITSVSLPDLTAPGAIADLAVVTSSTTSSSLEVSWTAIADDAASEPVTEYDVRYATFPLVDDQTFLRGLRVTALRPASPGSIERMTLVGLPSNTQYFVAIKVIDEAGNASLSNVAVGQTGLRRGYTLVSIPKELSTPDDTVSSVFEDDVDVSVSGLTVYRWSSRPPWGVDDGCYDGVPEAFSFNPQYTCTTYNKSEQKVGTALGYYLYNTIESSNGRWVLDATGNPVTTPTHPIPLERGFNMVGNPYEGEIPLSAVRVKRGATGTPIPYEEAVASPNGWVGPSLLLFDGVVSRPYGVSDPEAVFKPWNGGWIQSFYDDVILVFPHP
jgi:chitodextrinase